MSYIFTLLGITAWIVSTSVMSGVIISHENTKQLKSIEKTSQEVVQKIVADVLATSNNNKASEIQNLNTEAVLPNVESVIQPQAEFKKSDVNSQYPSSEVKGKGERDDDDDDDDDEGDDDND